MESHCDICECAYNKEDRIPKILDCGHIFCEKDLKLTQKMLGKITCPTCKQTSTKQTEDLITVNHLIIKTQSSEEIDQESQTNELASNLVEKQVEQQFSQEQFSSSQITRISSNEKSKIKYQVQTNLKEQKPTQNISNQQINQKEANQINQIKIQKQTNQKTRLDEEDVELQTCELHKEALKYICLDDFTLLCPSCLNEHQNHHYEDFKEKDQISQSLKSLKCAIKRSSQKLRNLKQEAEFSYQDSIIQFQNMQRQQDEYIDDVILSILQFKHDIKFQQQLIFKQIEEKQQKQREQIQSYIDLLLELQNQLANIQRDQA